MESDHLAHFGVRLQCLWTFTLPNSIFGVVRATNNREAASIQAYSGCGVDCGVQHRCCRHAKLRGSTCSRLQAWEGPKATSTVCSVRVHRYLRLTVFFLPKPSPSLTTWKIIVEMHPVGQLVLHLLCPGARDAGRSQEHRCAQLRCDEGRWQFHHHFDRHSATHSRLVHPKPAFGLVLWC